MTSTEIKLTDQEHASLTTIARQIGRTEAEVLQEAVRRYITLFQANNRRQLLAQARGMWRDREDLPDLSSLRRELDRHQG